MEDNKKGKGIVVVLVIFILLSLGLGGYICYDKILNKDNTEKITSDTKGVSENITDRKNTNKDDDIFANDKIHAYHYESKQEGSEKSLLTLIDAGNNSGYFSVRYISAYGSGSEAPLGNGYYRIDDNRLILSFGSDDITESVFKTMNANVVDDPNQETSPGYRAHILDYAEDELQIGSFKLYRVK